MIMINGVCMCVCIRGKRGMVGCCLEREGTRLKKQRSDLGAPGLNCVDLPKHRLCQHPGCLLLSNRGLPGGGPWGMTWLFPHRLT